MCSCYEALESGQTGEGLSAFTGGVNEHYDLRGGGYRDNEDKLAQLFDVRGKEEGLALQ